MRTDLTKLHVPNWLITELNMMSRFVSSNCALPRGPGSSPVCVCVRRTLTPSTYTSSSSRQDLARRRHFPSKQNKSRVSLAQQCRPVVAHHCKNSHLQESKFPSIGGGLWRPSVAKCCHDTITAKTFVRASVRHSIILM